ncbi:MAG: ABC transporter substrate-binding protein [Candidatus Cloacimonetes bacterium]|nr:ABC transporter substrate-binding protein [Candidatus Cloacimonadota bacterium]MCF7814810.1 ABC transporter substrate-binding protein [Candidatus Cloacimonadota bacterium]MCF7867660.1 ABC transporter substrate-binding protein [Candidatus Cloacimonadota bacterium]MCF7883542.1 ABC transporter substrate-binding protein [Candidatus Cloacimonadota bacterium]
MKVKVTKEVEFGITDTEILLGMSTVLTGPSDYLGNSFKNGAMSYFNRINKSGGIKGRNIKLIAYDDGYEPGRCIENTHKLIDEDKVFCLFGNVGTPTTMAIKPIIVEKHIPLIAPFTGAEPLRNPLVKEIFHYRASYYDEVEKFIKGVVDKLGMTKISCFYQDDNYGYTVLEGLNKSLIKRGLKLHSWGTYKRNTMDIQAGLDRIIPTEPDAVVMVGTYGSCAKFIIEGKKQDFNPVFMNVSFVGAHQLLDILNDAGQGDAEIITQVVPPEFSMLPAVVEARNDLNAYAPDEELNHVSLEGYLAAKVLVEGLTRSGNNLTRSNFIEQMESIKDLDIGIDHQISFSATDHQGSDKVYPAIVIGGEYNYFEDWQVISSYLN